MRITLLDRENMCNVMENTFSKYAGARKIVEKQPHHFLIAPLEPWECKKQVTKDSFSD